MPAVDQRGIKIMEGLPQMKSKEEILDDEMVKLIVELEEIYKRRDAVDARMQEIRDQLEQLRS